MRPQLRWWIGGAALVVVAVLIAARSRHRGATHATEHMTPGSAKAVRGSREVRRGSIAGTVRDEHAAPIAGARVCADVRFADPWCATTNAHGEYVIDGLPAGALEVTASAARHRPAVYRPDGDRHRAMGRADAEEPRRRR